MRVAISSVHTSFSCMSTLKASHKTAGVGLNIFYSEEKDWARHTKRQCPLQMLSISRSITGILSLITSQLRRHSCTCSADYSKFNICILGFHQASITSQWTNLAQINSRNRIHKPGSCVVHPNNSGVWNEGKLLNGTGICFRQYHGIIWWH